MATDSSRRRLLRFRRKSKPTSRVEAMTVMEHLRELRTRIIISALAFILISVIAFFFYDPIQTFLRTPLCDVPRDRLGPQGCELVFTKPTGGFQFRLKLTALVGLAVTSPIWIYQIYAFIVPALTSKEKRYSIPFLASSILLFLVGSTFAYLTLPVGLRFLIELGGEGLVPLVDAESYLSFVGFLLLAFGLTFELPLLLVFLGLVGAVSVEQLRQHRKTAFVSTFVLAAVVTPSQDPYTMSIMAIPLYLLYELTIIILRTVMRRRGAAQG